MKTKAENISHLIIATLVITAFLWVGFSTMVFAFRHPWATDMERFLHIPDALMFRKIPYEEMRGRN